MTVVRPPLMKLTCEKQLLQGAIQTAQRCASTKSTIPVLGGILLTATPAGLTLKATDLELAVECLIPAQVFEEGSVVAPARYLSDLVRRLPETDIGIELDTQTRNLVFTYGNSRFQLNTLNAEDFPLLPSVDLANALKMPQPEFKELVRKVGAAASADPIRPIFTGILCEFNDGVLTMVATDTHRLTRKRMTLENSIGGVNPVIIPNRALQELSRLLKDEDSDFSIVLSSGLVAFVTDEFTLTTRPIEGKFPDYEKVIPAEFKNNISLQRLDLLATLERAALLVSTRDGTSIVNLDIKESSLVLSSQAANLGSLREELVVESSGEPLEIYFNARYLIDALRVIDSERVTVDFSGALSPCVIKPLPEEDYLYMLLPIRF
ncbi:MAG: DNA polymerase III subunit beta [Firmicutes bacterium]|nr:DNA polymerase III subunit beta [Bacillota bacterium]